MNVSAPTMITTPTSIATNSGVWVGSVPGPNDCFLILRGVKTLGLRVDKHCTNAEQIAAFLREHPRVERVFYPDRDTVARRQMTRFGAIVSFEIDGGLDAAKAFAKEVKLWTLAESLGSVRSLFCHPPTMTHASMEPEVRRRVGIGAGPARGRGDLIWNLFCFRRGDEQIEHARIDVRTAKDHRPFANVEIPSSLFLDARCVGAVRDIEGNTDVRFA